MKINKYLTTYNYNTGSVDRIKYIVIHYVGATGGAKANCQYYASKYLGASAHYFVDFDGSIWQSVEDKNVAWSVGGKKYPNTMGGTFHGLCTNGNSLNIEMCVRKKDNTWYFEDETEKSTIELTKFLMKKYNIPQNNVIRHYDVTGKACPEPYTRDENRWKWFQEQLTCSILPIGWIFDNRTNKYWYHFGDGNFPRNDWYKAYCNTDDKYHWFLFDSSGWMQTGRKEFKGKIYYLEESGPLVGACMVSNERGELYYLDAQGD